MSLQANVAQHGKNDDKDGRSFDKGSRLPYKGSSWSFRGRGQGKQFSHNKLQCQLCGKIGHTVQKCYYRFDETFEGVSSPPMQVHCYQFQDSSSLPCGDSHCCSRKTVVSNSESQAHAVSTKGYSSPSSLNTKVWYPDSGASNHVTNYLENLGEVTPYLGTNRLLMGNGVSVPVDHIGFSSFATSDRVFQLKNVLHVPQICKNLIFVAQFANDNQVYFEFHPFHYFVKDIKTGTILLVGRIHDGLYQFDLSKAPRFGSSPITAHAACLKSSLNDSIFNLWHIRLGHPCHRAVTIVLLKCNIVSIHCKKDLVCSACQIGKCHKLHFSSSTTVYTAPFELVVSDLWGPASVASEGSLYYVSFVDAFSRYTWLYLIKHKSGALDRFFQLQKFGEVQFGCKIKTL